MKTYYLQFNEDIPHKMISSERNPEYMIENSVDAESWVEAKRLLGYDLTVEQEIMLEE